ncbi:sugar phosphate isomerase/epimerase family protein [Candidatus Sumerlaeota bacterium]
MRISLAGRSLRDEFEADENFLQLPNFPRAAKERFGIEAVELNSPYFHSTAPSFLDQIVERAAEVGVTMTSIAVDQMGDIACEDIAEQIKSVELNALWIEIAKSIGVQTIRLNAGGFDCPDSRQALADCIENLRDLCQRAESASVNVLIENNKGLCACPDRMLEIFAGVEMPNFGFLPDFGNWPSNIDRYQALAKIAPHTRLVHAKSYAFDDAGEETTIDYGRCLQVLREAGYDGYLGIEYEGGDADPTAGILKTKALIERKLGIDAPEIPTPIKGKKPVPQRLVTKGIKKGRA